MQAPRVLSSLHLPRIVSVSRVGFTSQFKHHNRQAFKLNYLSILLFYCAGNPALLQEESDIPKLVRKDNSEVTADIPDAVISNRFRNIISCSSKLPPGAAAKWEQMKASRPVRTTFTTSCADGSLYIPHLPSWFQAFALLVQTVTGGVLQRVPPLQTAYSFVTACRFVPRAASLPPFKLVSGFRELVQTGPPSSHVGLFLHLITHPMYGSSC
jgi:hypothetical protein